MKQCFIFSEKSSNKDLIDLLNELCQSNDDNVSQFLEGKSPSSPQVGPVTSQPGDIAGDIPSQVATAQSAATISSSQSQSQPLLQQPSQLSSQVIVQSSSQSIGEVLLSKIRRSESVVSGSLFSTPSPSPPPNCHGNRSRSARSHAGVNTEQSQRARTLSPPLGSGIEQSVSTDTSRLEPPALNMPAEQGTMPLDVNEAQVQCIDDFQRANVSSRQIKMAPLDSVMQLSSEIPQEKKEMELGDSFARGSSESERLDELLLAASEYDISCAQESHTPLSDVGLWEVQQRGGTESPAELSGGLGSQHSDGKMDAVKTVYDMEEMFSPEHRDSGSSIADFMEPISPWNIFADDVMTEPLVDEGSQSKESCVPALARTRRELIKLITSSQEEEDGRTRGEDGGQEEDEDREEEAAVEGEEALMLQAVWDDIEEFRMSVPDEFRIPQLDGSSEEPKSRNKTSSLSRGGARSVCKGRLGMRRRMGVVSKSVRSTRGLQEGRGLRSRGKLGQEIALSSNSETVSDVLPVVKEGENAGLPLTGSGEKNEAAKSKPLISVDKETEVQTLSEFPIPKKRGRPKKVSSVGESNISPSSLTEKIKEGQPEQEVVTQQDVVVDAVQTLPIPKKRGRPKKASSEGGIMALESSPVETVKEGQPELDKVQTLSELPKKRGRPKKVLSEGEANVLQNSPVEKMKEDQPVLEEVVKKSVQVGGVQTFSELPNAKKGGRIKKTSSVRKVKGLLSSPVEKVKGQPEVDKVAKEGIQVGEVQTSKLPILRKRGRPKKKSSEGVEKILHSSPVERVKAWRPDPSSETSLSRKRKREDISDSFSPEEATYPSASCPEAAVASTSLTLKEVLAQLDSSFEVTPKRKRGRPRLSLEEKKKRKKVSLSVPPEWNSQRLTRSNVASTSMEETSSLHKKRGRPRLALLSNEKRKQRTVTKAKETTLNATKPKPTVKDYTSPKTHHDAEHAPQEEWDSHSNASVLKEIASGNHTAQSEVIPMPSPASTSYSTLTNHALLCKFDLRLQKLPVQVLFKQRNSPKTQDGSSLELPAPPLSTQMSTIKTQGGSKRQGKSKRGAMSGLALKKKKKKQLRDSPKADRKLGEVENSALVKGSSGSGAPVSVTPATVELPSDRQIGNNSTPPTQHSSASLGASSSESDSTPSKSGWGKLLPLVSPCKCDNVTSDSDMGQANIVTSKTDFSLHVSSDSDADMETEEARGKESQGEHFQEIILHGATHQEVAPHEAVDQGTEVSSAQSLGRSLQGLAVGGKDSSKEVCHNSKNSACLHVEAHSSIQVVQNQSSEGGATSAMADSEVSASPLLSPATFVQAATPITRATAADDNTLGEAAARESTGFTLGVCGEGGKLTSVWCPLVPPLGWKDLCDSAHLHHIPAVVHKKPYCSNPRDVQTAK